MNPVVFVKKETENYYPSLLSVMTYLMRHDYQLDFMVRKNDELVRYFGGPYCSLVEIHEKNPSLELHLYNCPSAIEEDLSVLLS